MRRRAAGLAAAIVLTAGAGASGTPEAGAQAPPVQVRLAAPADCLRNAGCGEGLRRVYRLDVGAAFVALASADAGVSALDDGVAEVAVAFTSDPQLSRPDILTLRDDRAMLGGDHVVPIVRARLLDALGRRRAATLRRQADALSDRITTLALRSLNQQVADGRLAEPVGGEFVDRHGLGGDATPARGRVVRIGYQDFTENAVLAHAYAQALRAVGLRTRVVAVGGLRTAALSALRTARVDLVPEYAGSLHRALGGEATLRRALRRRGLRALAQAPGENRNAFVMRRDVAALLGVTKLSDLGRYWPAAP